MKNNNDEIMVSILCAAYNHEQFIEKALQSFLMQKTSFKYEVIINEDASTDSTASIIKKYQEKYPDIIKPIYQKKNQYSQGKNVLEIMLEKSQGKYIATCEGDDYWIDEQKLQKQVDFMERHIECSLYGHANNIVNQDGKYIRTRKDCEKTGYVNLIENGGYIHFATRLARREVYSSFPDILKKKYYEGVAYIYYAHYLGKIYYDEKPMSVWRINQNSVTHSLYLGNQKSKEIAADYLSFFEKFNEYTKGKFLNGIKIRSSEQIAEMVKKCRKILNKKDFENLKKSLGFSKLNWKYKIYISLKCYICSR